MDFSCRNLNISWKNGKWRSHNWMRAVCAGQVCAALARGLHYSVSPGERNILLLANLYSNIHLINDSLFSFNHEISPTSAFLFNFKWIIVRYYLTYARPQRDFKLLSLSTLSHGSCPISSTGILVYKDF